MYRVCVLECVCVLNLLYIHSRIKVHSSVCTRVPCVLELVSVCTSSYCVLDKFTSIILCKISNRKKKRNKKTRHFPLRYVTDRYIHYPAASSNFQERDFRSPGAFVIDIDRLWQPSESDYPYIKYVDNFDLCQKFRARMITCTHMA